MKDDTLVAMTTRLENSIRISTINRGCSAMGASNMYYYETMVFDDTAHFESLKNADSKIVFPDILEQYEDSSFKDAALLHVELKEKYEKRGS